MIIISIAIGRCLSKLSQISQITTQGAALKKLRGCECDLLKEHIKGTFQRPLLSNNKGKLKLQRGLKKRPLKFLKFH